MTDQVYPDRTERVLESPCGCYEKHIFGTNRGQKYGTQGYSRTWDYHCPEHRDGTEDEDGFVLSEDTPSGQFVNI
jgi:hypothetical protein